MKILPDTTIPALAFDTVRGGRFDLAQRRPGHFTMLVTYRGHHCPLCKKQLQELNSLMSDYGKLGVEVVAVSANDQELATRAVDEWELTDLPVGHSLPRDQALQWGLHLSKAVKDTEPEWFIEPGIFVIRPDQTLYASVIQTMPFSRPTGRQLLSSLSWIVENDYPARGGLA